MNEKLANVLIELVKPEKRLRFEADANGFLEQTDLSVVDKLALISRNKGILSYQARFGDLSEEQLRKIDFTLPEPEPVEHIVIQDGPEHEGEEMEGEPATSFHKHTFGPHARTVGAVDDMSVNGSVKPTQRNSLVIVGTGIGVAHLTREASNSIAAADVLLYCVADPATELEIRRLNPNHEDLHRFYADGKHRRDTYKEMAERILSALHDGRNVCAAFYGHPGLFVMPAHRAIEQARAQGYEARMCASTSSIDCLIADLEIDLSWDGCQIFEATHFLVRNRKPDIQSGIILLQIGCVGDSSFNSKGFDGRHFPLLIARLAEYFGADHQVVLYEAAQFPVCRPRVDVVSIKNLASVRINGMTTMYIPPVHRAPIDPALSRYFKENAPSYP